MRMVSHLLTFSALPAGESALRASLVTLGSSLALLRPILRAGIHTLHLQAKAKLLFTGSWPQDIGTEGHRS